MLKASKEKQNLINYQNQTFSGFSNRICPSLYQYCYNECSVKVFENLMDLTGKGFEVLAKNGRVLYTFFDGNILN